MPTETYLKRLERVEPYAELWRDDKKFVEHHIGLYATLYFEHTHPMVASDALLHAFRCCLRGTGSATADR